LVEALFRAYFEEGRDVGDPEVLTDLARSAGLDPDEARTVLQDPALEAEVVATEAQAAGIGVSGVPFFIVDRAWAMSGAQPSEQWVAALKQRLGPALTSTEAA
jgi:predicted DsbA family dithiol-disulfide isomerase